MIGLVQMKRRRIRRRHGLPPPRRGRGSRAPVGWGAPPRRW